LHGQHTGEILRGLGYDDVAIATLTAQGAIHMPRPEEMPA
jgi:crotonobetainyl-CoA:carnitine CoA-transferase CaiB-like acyl-CoA transferase